VLLCVLVPADFNNHAVRLVHPKSDVINTVAGSGEAGFSGDGGPATNATLGFPAGLALDPQGRLLIADMNNHVIRRVTFPAGSASGAYAGMIETIAGTPGSEGFSGDGQEATSAQLSSPADVAVDAAGNVLIVDSDNHRIRRVDAATGIITTIAGSGQEGSSGDHGAALAAGFSAPQGVTVGPNGDIYVADTMNQRVRLLRCA
jgi:DNA-binding beta-propeller fold protein YncE